MHGIRVVCPWLEMVFVDGELLREGLDMRRVFVEKNLHHVNSEQTFQIHPED